MNIKKEASEKLMVLGQRAQMFVRAVVFSKWFPYVIIATIVLNVFTSAINLVKPKTYTQEFVNALQDSVSVYKNSNNELVARTQLLSSENANTLLDLKNANASITRLQKQVKANKNRLGKTGSVTTASTSTNVSGTLTQGDTLSYKDDWIDLKVKNPDFALSVKNNPTIVIGEDDNGKFVEIHDDNPYVTTKDVRTYQKEEKKSIFKIIFDARSYILGGAAAGYILGHL